MRNIRQRTPLKWVKVTYRLFYKDSSKYLTGSYGVPTDIEDVVEHLKEYLTNEWSEKLKYLDDIEYIKLISINGVKVNLEIH